MISDLPDANFFWNIASLSLHCFFLHLLPLLRFWLKLISPFHLKSLLFSIPVLHNLPRLLAYLAGGYVVSFESYVLFPKLTNWLFVLMHFIIQYFPPLLSLFAGLGYFLYTLDFWLLLFNLTDMPLRYPFLKTTIVVFQFSWLSAILWLMGIKRCHKKVLIQ